MNKKIINEGYRLLIKKEWNELLGGKSRKNLLFLIFVFALSASSISISSAYLSYLEYKMKDRFVNCVDVIVDQGGGDENELKYFLYNICDKDSLGIESMEPVFLLAGNFYDNNRNIIQLDGRSCSDSCLLYSCVLSNLNVVGGKVNPKPLMSNDMAIIVSVDGLKKLGLDTTAVFLEQVEMVQIDSTMKIDSDTNAVEGIDDVVWRSFSVPIYAIVNELPDMCDFLVTEAYIRQKFIGTARGKSIAVKNRTPFDVTDWNLNKSLCICIPDSIKDSLLEHITHDSLSVCVEKYKMSYSNDYSKLIVKSQHDFDMKLYDSLYVVYSSCFNDINRVYDFDFPEYEIGRRPQLYSCFFENISLQNVEKFREQLKSEVNYNIDMSKIYSMNNLFKVQDMVEMLSYLVILISILFLWVFVSLLLNSHFQKIRVNLGIFKASGINNVNLIVVYICLMFGATLLAFVLAFAFLIVVAFVLYLFNLCIEQGFAFIDIWAKQNLYLLGLATVASVLITLLVASKLLRQTPGDLIYDRKNDSVK